MRILHISDTHSKHRELPPLPNADIIIHSGMNNHRNSFDYGIAVLFIDSSFYPVVSFINWFCDLPFQHKIFIAGNHDLCMYGVDSIDGLPNNVHYLCNNSIEISNVTFFGIPLFMEDIMDGSFDRMINDIPDNTNVLITHQAPYGFCDEYGEHHCGDRALREKTDMLPSLRCHLYGHQHEANAMIACNGIIFSNAAVLDNHYNLIANSRVIEL